MSKLLLLSLLFVSALAAAKGDGEARLSYKTNLGYGQSFRLELKGKTYVFEGVRLSQGDLVKLGDSLAQVLAVPRKPAESADHDPTCGAGEFTHTVVLGGKTRIEKGCLSDERFTQLQTAFERIRDHRDPPGQ